MKKGTLLKSGKSIVLLVLVTAVLSFVTAGCEFTDEGVRSTPERKIKVTTGNAATVKERNEISDEEAGSYAEQYMEQLSLEEKVGQLFIVDLECLDPSKGSYYEHTKITKQMKQNLGRYHPGGVIFYSRNIERRMQTRRLIRRLQRNSYIPLFTAVDEEGGDVARIASNPRMKTTRFPSMAAIGESYDVSYAKNMATIIGEEIGNLGFNLDLAPVADVNTSPLNYEIGSRSFGSDPKKVSQYVTAYVRGLQSMNVSATLKHFPGQGGQKGDTHRESVDLDQDISILRNNDFKPFEAGIKAGADMVMVSHVSVSKVTETREPASLSELIMQTILREELGFNGVIITDAFNMASITDKYTSGEAAVTAFKNGADIILMPENFQEAYSSVLQYVKKNKQAREDLDEKILRILTVKFKRGIIKV